MEHRRFSETDSGAEYNSYERLWQRVAPAETASFKGKTPAERQDTAAGITARQIQELRLPGAEENPCCMGSEAKNMLLVLEGFGQEEALDAAAWAQLSRYAPTRSAAAAVRELGKRAGERSHTLAAACYLITGEQKKFQPAAVLLPRLPYRELLRQRYHNTACNALNYARAAEETMDPCLARLLGGFSEECYRDAERILRLMAQMQ